MSSTYAPSTLKEKFYRGVGSLFIGNTSSREICSEFVRVEDIKGEKLENLTKDGKKRKTKLSIFRICHNKKSTHQLIIHQGEPLEERFRFPMDSINFDSHKKHLKRMVIYFEKKEVFVRVSFASEYERSVIIQLIEDTRSINKKYEKLSVLDKNVKIDLHSPYIMKLFPEHSKYDFRIPQKKYDRWNMIDFLSWLVLIPYYVPAIHKNKKVKPGKHTLFHYLENNHGKVLKRITSLKENIWDEVKALLFNNVLFEQEGKNAETTRASDCLKSHFEYFQFLFRKKKTYIFTIHYYVLLWKRAKSYFSSRSKLLSSLNNYQEEVELKLLSILHDSQLWNFRDLQLRILFSLSIGMDFESWITKLKNDFRNFVDEHFDNTSVISPLEIVSLFKEKKGVDIQYFDIICFRDWIKHGDFESFLRIFKDNNNSVKSKEEIGKIYDEIKENFEKEKDMKDRLQLLEKGEEEEKKSLALINDVKKKIKKSIQRIFYFEVEETRREFIKKRIDEEVKALGGAGKKSGSPSSPSQAEEEGEDFYEADNGVNLKVKLVVSKIMAGGNNIMKPVTSAAFNLFTALFSPEFAEYGYLHTYCMVCNLGFHWFNNEIVSIGGSGHASTASRTLSRNFEDVICLDVTSPRCYNTRSLFEFTQIVSRFVIQCNLHQRYSESSISKRFYKLNCQEFSKKFLKVIGAKRHSRLELKFLDTIKTGKYSLMEVKEVLEDDDEKTTAVNTTTTKTKKYYYFQYLDFPTGFPKKLRNLFCEGKKGNKIVFKSHKELDETVILFFKEFGSREKFIQKFPDVYVMLKGFDRAYWLMKRCGKEDPTKRLMPLTSMLIRNYFQSTARVLLNTVSNIP